MVAWFDRCDQDHGICAAFFRKHNGAFVSTWPVLTEVCHLIPTDVAPRFLSWVSLGGLNVAELSGSALELIAGWMRQYGDFRWIWLTLRCSGWPRCMGCSESQPSIDATSGSSDFLVVRASKTCWMHEHSVATCSPVARGRATGEGIGALASAVHSDIIADPSLRSCPTQAAALPDRAPARASASAPLRAPEPALPAAAPAPLH